MDLSEEIVEIYTDGGVIRKNPSIYGGTWAWCGVNRNNERIAEGSGYFFWEGRLTTNNHTEQIALLKGMECIKNPDWKGLVCSDSMCALGRQFLGHRRNNLPPNLCNMIDLNVDKFNLQLNENIEDNIQWLLLAGHPTKKELDGEYGTRDIFIRYLNDYKTFPLQKPDPLSFGDIDQLPMSEHNKHVDELCKKQAGIAKQILIEKGLLNVDKKESSSVS